MVAKLAAAILAGVGGIDRRQVQLLGHISHEAGQVALRQPVLQRRG